MTSNDLGAIDATEHARLIRTGEVTAAEVVEDAIARIESIDPAVNAVIHRRFDAARAECDSLPDGPFRGVPFLFKDLACAVAGDPHHWGMRALRDAGHVETSTSEVAARLLAAGLVNLGRTNTPELGSGVSTEPLAYGPTRNPWDLTRSAGGSSGGSAAAVAARMVPAAHGNDGGGSVRIPASMCGVVGLKPSRGRIPVTPDGHGPADNGLPVHGMLARTVRDVAGLLDVAARHSEAALYPVRPPVRPFAAEVGAPAGRLRIGLTTRTPSRASPTGSDCTRAARAAAQLLEDLGHTVEDAHPRALEEPELTQRYVVAYGASAIVHIRALGEAIGRSLGPGDVEPTTSVLARMGEQLSAADSLAAAGWLQGYRSRLLSWWHTDGWDLLVTPTLPDPPPLLGTVHTPANPVAGMAAGAAVPAYTMPFNVSGQPAISLPLHWTDDGLPVGVQLVAGAAQEALLIRVAAQLEQACPWAHRRAPVSA